MDATKTRQRVYLALAVLGAALPLSAFIPWLIQHGLDIDVFVAELFANRISAFFGWDVIVSVLTLLVTVVLFPGKLTTSQRVYVGLGSLVGSSLGLPLYFYFAERGGARAT